MPICQRSTFYSMQVSARAAINTARVVTEWHWDDQHRNTLADTDEAISHDSPYSESSYRPTCTAAERPCAARRWVTPLASSRRRTAAGRRRSSWRWRQSANRATQAARTTISHTDNPGNTSPSSLSFVSELSQAYFTIRLPSARLTIF